MLQIYQQTVCIFCGQMGRRSKNQKAVDDVIYGSFFSKQTLDRRAVAGAPGPIRPISIESGYFHRGHVT